MMKKNQLTLMAALLTLSTTLAMAVTATCPSQITVSPTSPTTWAVTATTGGTSINWAVSRVWDGATKYLSSFNTAQTYYFSGVITGNQQLPYYSQCYYSPASQPLPFSGYGENKDNIIALGSTTELAFPENQQSWYSIGGNIMQCRNTNPANCALNTIILS
jgi:hypothetical protein